MKKTYIKPDITILKMGTSAIICASNSKANIVQGKYVIGDDAEFEARYDKKWTIEGVVEFDEGTINTR